ncbi:hypothetical protein C0J52_09150 [Blattella germanica]|nr:hypothetical protein C0J52_09150 [Blattella germanica]
MSSGHRELNMVISELKDVRSTAKAFAVAQNTATQDMLKWSVNEENPAIQDTFVQMTELNAIWSEVQREFADHLKEFITQFEMILEGEQHIDQARTHVTTCELRAAKIKKELKKAKAVQRAKEQIHAYRRHRGGSVAPCAPIPDGPPPPYSPTNHGPLENAPYNPHYLPQSPPDTRTLNSSNPFHSSPERVNSQLSLPEASGECPPRNRTSFSPSTNPFDGDLEDNDSRLVHLLI